MKRLPSRFRRLDGALAELPLEEPMLLTELDGLLTGVVVSPEPITPKAWLPIVWGDDVDGVPPFDDLLDVQWFRDAVIARLDEIGRNLTRGRLQPIFDVDESNGDVLWEPWIDGFAEAMALRPDEWSALAEGDDADAAAAIGSLSELIAVARGESELDTPTLNALDASAPADLAAAVLRLHAARARSGGFVTTARGTAPIKVGRNEPCRCGSGRKSKRCCG